MPLIDLALVNNVWTLKLSMIQTVGLAVITLFIGTWINKHSKFLQRMCMPAPAVGALPFAFLTASDISSFGKGRRYLILKTPALIPSSLRLSAASFTRPATLPNVMIM
mgnify:CR=1 FL=1